MTDRSSFRVTLRQMADAEDAQDRRRLYDMLASQLEVALNNQANSTQVVLWDVQEKAYQKIDALHEHQADTNLLLVGVADSLARIQASVQQVLTAHKETARGLKKVQAQMKESQADRRELHRENAGIKADVAAIQARLDRYDEIERRLAALESRGDGA